MMPFASLIKHLRSTHAQSILVVISNVAFAIAMEQPTEKKLWTLSLSLSLKRPLSEHFQSIQRKITQSKKLYVPDKMLHATDLADGEFEQWRDFYNSKQYEIQISLPSQLCAACYQVHT